MTGFQINSERTYTSTFQGELVTVDFDARTATINLIHYQDIQFISYTITEAVIIDDKIISQATKRDIFIRSYEEM